MPVTGVLAPVPTPFDEQDRVDLVRLRAAFEHWAASLLSGFVVLGSNAARILPGAEASRTPLRGTSVGDAKDRSRQTQ